VPSSAGTGSLQLTLPSRTSMRRRYLNRSRLRRLRLALRDPGVAKPSPRERSDPASVAAVRADTIRALRTLPLRQLQALLLVEWLDMTSDEAGKALGIAPESVRGRVHRAKIMLRERFGGDDE
jgi:DNA-directed RNA polymerase specialized sigma24 family protein